MKRLNILLILDVFAFDTPGGTGTIFYNYAKGLAKRGHNVFVLFRRRNEKIPLCGIIDGIHFYTYDNNHKSALLFTVFFILNTSRLFKTILRETSLDLLNIHHPIPVIGISLCRESRNIPQVYSFNAPWDLEYKLDKDIHAGHLVEQLWFRINFIIRRLIEKRSLNKCKKIVVLSKYSKGLLQKIHRVSSSKIEIIYGGVDVKRFKPAEDKKSVRNNLSIPQNRFVLLTIRRLVPRMGLQNLIKALSLIVKEKKDIYLIVAGKGPLEDSLKELTDTLKLKNYIRFVGFIEDEQLPLYYQSADLFILPTLELEGFGLVTLEALSSGIPVLGTPVGGTKEILSQLNDSLLFSGTDADSMAKLILKYISSPERISELEPRCGEFATKNYSWDVIISKIEALFLKLSDLSKNRFAKGTDEAN